jgi:hypothetical protein
MAVCHRKEQTLLREEETEAMKQYDDTNRFVLFINDNDANPKAPTHKGTININGTEYRIAGWLKQSPRGAEFISGSVESMDAFKPENRITPVKDDEIPF